MPLENQPVIVGVSWQKTLRVSVVPRRSLNDEELRSLGERVAAPEHEYDKGPCAVWNTPSYLPNLYVVLESRSQGPIGILYADDSLTAINVGWWLDSLYRGKLYAGEAIDLFAAYLKENGVTGVGSILVDTNQGKYHEASSRLVARFKAHFK